MALIGKIRNNMWVVFIIIALATASFILMDAMGPGGGQSTVNTAIGSVGGEKIKQIDFEKTYSALFNNSNDVNAGREALWNYLVDKTITEKEANAIGAGVGYDELMDLQFGANISPVIYNTFRNPQTGQLDVQQLQNIKNQLQSGNITNPQFAQFWGEQEKQIKTVQLQSKISNLASKAIYTPNWLAEAAYKEENGTVDIEYVKIPFEKMEAGSITVSDDDILAYANKDKDAYYNEKEQRVIEYVELDVIPSDADSAKWKADMEDIMNRWSTAPKDSAFAFANSGFYSPFYFKAEEVDEFYQDKIADFEVGKIYGPYVVGRSYQAAKLIDKQVLPDSVKASHILRRITPGNVTQGEEAEALIDSLYTVLQRNKSKFGDLAEEFSEDLSNNTDGGDLGYFAQGAMVKQFNDVAFKTGKPGNIYKLRTQFGWHLVYVQDQKFLTRESKYQIAFVNKLIIPTKETQDDANTVMLDLISSYPYLEELKTAVNGNPNLSMQKSSFLGENDYIINGLGGGNTSRDIVKFAFEKGTSVGDVSPTVYSYSDPISFYTNKYVVAGLSSIVEPGMPPISDLRNQLEFAVLNQKKGEKVSSEISGTDLSSIATKYNVNVATAEDIGLLSTFVAGLGNEPEVIGAAHGLSIGSVSAPILGNSGVFIVKTTEKNEAGAISGLASLKRTISTSDKSRAGAALFDALKESIEIKDGRAKYY